MTDTETNVDINETKFVHAAASVLSRVDGKLNGALTDIMEGTDNGEDMGTVEVVLVTCTLVSGMSDTELAPVSKLFEKMEADSFSDLTKEDREKIDHQFGLLTESVKMFMGFGGSEAHVLSHTTH